MPYICLANEDVEGVQILDLHPNASQLIPHQGSAQSAYINRVQNDAVVLEADGTVSNLSVDGLQAYLLDNVDSNAWTTATLKAAADALVARVDAGLALAVADVNTVLTAALGGATTLTGGDSTATLTGLLSVLAGRGYRIKRTDSDGAPNVFLTGGADWAVGPRGGFTESVLVHGSVMSQGEIKSAAVGGDTVQREIRPIRTFVDSDSFKISAALGTLAAFNKVDGAPPVTLWPDSDVVPHFPWSMQPAVNGSFGETADARVVTIYNDDGSLYE